MQMLGAGFTATVESMLEFMERERTLSATLPRHYTIPPASRYTSKSTALTGPL